MARQQKYCNKWQSGRLISEACTASCEACNEGPSPTNPPTKAPTSGRDFDPTSSTITNDEMWYDDDGNMIHANRCGSISPEKYGRYWYMVGSKASEKWVS